MNLHNADFGFDDEGNKISDVKLPIWASSPHLFVHMMRKQLEKSKNIHKWIDLIFGVA